MEAPPEIPRRMWEDNIKIKLAERGCDCGSRWSGFGKVTVVGVCKQVNRVL
jgi:hypothetical protein